MYLKNQDGPDNQRPDMWSSIVFASSFTRPKTAYYEGVLITP